MVSEPREPTVKPGGLLTHKWNSGFVFDVKGGEESEKRRTPLAKPKPDGRSSKRPARKTSVQKGAFGHSGCLRRCPLRRDTLCYK